MTQIYKYKYWQDWAGSEEGKRCLSSMPSSLQYLDNRLWAAFVAGRETQKADKSVVVVCTCKRKRQRVRGKS